LLEREREKRVKWNEIRKRKLDLNRNTEREMWSLQTNLKDRLKLSIKTKIRCKSDYLKDYNRKG
jgi:hypothetical protein